LPYFLCFVSSYAIFFPPPPCAESVFSFLYLTWPMPSSRTSLNRRDEESRIFGTAEGQRFDLEQIPPFARRGRLALSPVPPPYDIAFYVLCDKAFGHLRSYYGRRLRVFSFIFLLMTKRSAAFLTHFSPQLFFSVTHPGACLLNGFSLSPLLKRQQLPRQVV